MSWAPCKFIKRIVERQPKSTIKNVPPNTRGIYALLNQSGHSFDVVYVGLSAGDRAGIRSRLKAHNPHKGDCWTHFSIFEVHDNITRQEIQELEGLFRHIYAKDSQANKLNKQVRHRPFRKISVSLTKWQEGK